VVVRVAQGELLEPKSSDHDASSVHQTGFVERL